LAKWAGIAGRIRLLGIPSCGIVAWACQPTQIALGGVLGCDVVRSPISFELCKLNDAYLCALRCRIVSCGERLPVWIEPFRVVLDCVLSIAFVASIAHFGGYLSPLRCCEPAQACHC
jgi:hypothetical protein